MIIKQNISMYNTKINCNYQNHFYNVNNNNVNSDNYDLVNKLYQDDFLKVFGVEDYYDEIINSTINDIYSKLSKLENMNGLLKKLATKFMSQDAEIGLMVGLSYDYFYLMHPCICDLLEKGEITSVNYDSLKNSIENNINENK
jgi:hypothetical protein